MRLKWASVVAAVCLVVTVAAIAYAAGKTSVPEVMRAQRFELMDEEGRVWARLSVPVPRGNVFEPAGDGRMRPARPYPELALYDGEGNERVVLGIAMNTPALFLGNRGEAERSLSASVQDRNIVLLGQNGRPRVVLANAGLETTRSGAREKPAEPSLTLFDGDGKVLWEAP